MAKTKGRPEPLVKKAPAKQQPPAAPAPVEPPKPTFPYPDNPLVRFEAALLALFGNPKLSDAARKDLNQLAVSASQWERDAWIRLITHLKGR